MFLEATYESHITSWTNQDRNQRYTKKVDVKLSVQYARGHAMDAKREKARKFFGRREKDATKDKREKTCTWCKARMGIKGGKTCNPSLARKNHGSATKCRKTCNLVQSGRNNKVGTGHRKPWLCLTKIWPVGYHKFFFPQVSKQTELKYNCSSNLLMADYISAKKHFTGEVNPLCT